MIRNQFTQDYEEFKKIPEEDRDQYCKKIVAIPQDQDSYEYPEIAPDFYDKIPVVSEDSEQIDICLYIWEPKGQPKGLIFMIHGINAYMGTLSTFADYVRTHNDLIVIGHDVRNFGRSTGSKRGYLQDLDQISQDIVKVIEWGIAKYGEALPMFMAGFSMGGALTIKYATQKRHKFTGIILLAPGIQINPASKFIMGPIQRVKIALFPYTYLFPNNFNLNVRHQPLIKKLQEDPLMYKGDVWAGTVANINKYAQSIREMAKDFQFTYLFVMGGHDKLINPFVIVDFDQKSPSKDKTNMLVKDMWHSLFFDKRSNDVIAQVSKWISLKLHKKKQ